MTSCGVPAGAPSMPQPPMATSMPWSIAVWTSGSASAASSARTASTRSWPSAWAWEVSETPATTASTWPPIAAVTAGAPPSNGTGRNWAPVSSLRRVVAACQMEPAPELETVMVSGFCVAASMRSCSVWYGLSAGTAIVAGTETICPRYS